MRARPWSPGGWLPVGVIFLFITAFDLWPTEARAEGNEPCRPAGSMGSQVSGSGDPVTGPPGRAVLDRIVARKIPTHLGAAAQQDGETPLRRISR